MTLSPEHRLNLTQRLFSQAGWLLGNAETRGDAEAERRLKIILEDLKAIDKELSTCKS